MVLSESMIELPIKSGITCTIPILNFTIVTFSFMSCRINNVQALFDPLQHDASCLILRPLFTGSTGNTSAMDPMQKPGTIFRYVSFPRLFLTQYVTSWGNFPPLHRCSTLECFISRGKKDTSLRNTSTINPVSCVRIRATFLELTTETSCAHM